MGPELSDRADYPASARNPHRSRCHLTFSCLDHRICKFSGSKIITERRKLSGLRVIFSISSKCAATRPSCNLSLQSGAFPVRVAAVTKAEHCVVASDPGDCILIVSEDRILRQLAAGGLAEQRFILFEAGSFDEASQILGDGVRFDLLVIDIDLPSSFALAIEARAINGNIPILFITDRDETVEETRQQIVGRRIPLPYGVLELGEARARHEPRDGKADGHSEGYGHRDGHAKIRQI